MDHYVLAFIFSHDLKEVLLVNKQRPDWQKGKWNGLGGHIEKDEFPFQAVKREISEEIYGASFALDDITHAVTFVCPGGTVWVYKMLAGRFDNLTEIRSRTDEPVKAFYVKSISGWANMLDSMKWLIPLILSDVCKPILLSRLKKSV